MSRGEYATAQARLEAALALRRELGDKWHMSFVLDSLGDAYLAGGDYERARACSEESIALIREHGDRNIAIYAMRQLGRALMREGDFLRAAAMFQESLSINLAIEDRRGSAACLAGLGGVAMARGQIIRAVQLYGAVEAFVSAIGIPLLETDRQAYDHNVAALRAQIDEATFQAAWDKGRALTLEQSIAEAARVTESEQVTPSTSTQTLVPTYPAGLTAREVEVLRLLAQGLTDAQIAETLVVSTRTVNSHLRSIFSKLDVTTRTAAARVAMEHKIV